MDDSETTLSGSAFQIWRHTLLIVVIIIGLLLLYVICN